MRVLVLLLLLGGVVWCATTEQGKLTHIKAGAALGVYPPVLNLDIRALDEDLAQADLQPDYQGVKLPCRPEKQSGLGDTVCYSDISLLNGIPAYSAAFFFRDESVSAVRLAFQRESGEKLEHYLQTEFAAVPTITKSRGAGEPALVHYMLPKGMLLTSEQTSRLDERILLWMPR